MQKAQKIAKLLAQLDLTDKEVNVYLGLLKLGSSSASQIAHETAIARTYVYDIAEDLRKKGFLSALDRKNIRHYEALSHPELVALIKRKNEQLEQLGKEVSEAVSDFESLRQDVRQATKVEFFSGPDGVLNIYDQIKNDLKKLREPFEIITIFSPEKLEAAFPGWFEQKKYIDFPPYMTKRDIVHESEIFKKHLQQRAQSASTYAYKIWPKSKGEFPADTLCWQNKIAFVELSSYPTGTIIENEAVVKTFKMWFEEMWANL